MALHEQSVGKTDEWYTPKYVFDALDTEFDMDVASPGPVVVPWMPAKQHICSGSLEASWSGFIWMNPPFGGRNGLIPWLQKFIAHANGIALVPDRTSAPWWQNAMCNMDSVLFVSPKIKFIGVDGVSGRSPAQGTALMALGASACEALHTAEINGLGTLLWNKA